jgi:hypothetical protein
VSGASLTGREGAGPTQPGLNECRRASRSAPRPRSVSITMGSTHLVLCTGADFTTRSRGGFSGRFTSSAEYLQRVRRCVTLSECFTIRNTPRPTITLRRVRAGTNDSPGRRTCRDGPFRRLAARAQSHEHIEAGEARWHRRGGHHRSVRRGARRARRIGQGALRVRRPWASHPVCALRGRRDVRVQGVHLRIGRHRLRSGRQLRDVRHRPGLQRRRLLHADDVLAAGQELRDRRGRLRRDAELRHVLSDLPDLLRDERLPV